MIPDGDRGLLLVKEKTPDECWSIYNNSTTSTIPTDFGQITNTPENGYNQITQICSAAGCPPPEYEVICNCNEQCPVGTCEVYCGQYLCCYDSTGKAVKAIHHSDIPNFGIPENTIGLNDIGGNLA